MGDSLLQPRQDWRLPESAKPPLVSELVERIDEALATARASEAAVMTVGAAALDAAEQARRAADLAERASAAIHADRAAPTLSTLAPTDDDGLGDFGARADRVAERLRRLQRVPLSA
jgi:MoxR-like ATPase